MAIQMIAVGIVLLVTSTFGGYFAYLCRRKAYSRKSANSSTDGSEKSSVPVQASVKTKKNAVKIRVSVVSASSSITTEKTYDDSNTSDNVSHISTASQSVRSLPEFIPNYVSLDKTVEANRGSIKLASFAFPPLGYTPSEENSSCVGGHRHSGIGSSATSSACHSASDNESIGSNNGGVVMNGLRGQDGGGGVGRMTVKKMVVGTAHTKTSGTMMKRMSFSSTNSLDSAGPDPIHPMSTGDSMSIDAMPITTAIMMR